MERIFRFLSRSGFRRRSAPTAGGLAVVAGVLRGGGEEGLGPGHGARDLVREVGLRGLARAADGVLDRERVGPAVADEADAVHADERRAADLAPVHAPLHPLEGALREERADLR